MKNKKVVIELVVLIVLAILIDISLIAYDKLLLNNKEDTKQLETNENKNLKVSYICLGETLIEDSYTYTNSYGFSFHPEEGIENGYMIDSYKFKDRNSYNNFTYECSFQPCPETYQKEEEEENLRKTYYLGVGFASDTKNVEEYIKTLEKMGYSDCKKE